ncbi:MAG: M3 family metallopeptidase [Oligoflexus sp.]
MTAAPNPLLHNLKLPAFDKIEPQHVIPAVETILNDCEQELAAIEAKENATWNSLVAPMEAMSRRFGAVWGPVTHLVNVKNSQPLRDAFNQVLPRVVKFSLQFSQSQPIHRSLKKIQKSKEWADLTKSQRRMLENKIRDAEFSGIGLEGKERERFNEISHRLSELGTQFSNHVLDATKEYALIIENAKDMEGIPDSFLGMWAENYNQRKKPKKEATASSGPWAISLDYASYEPFLKYCQNRKLREELYRANVTKASSGSFDNTANIYEILRLRREQAQLLGYQTYAELSLAKKMAGSVERVEELLLKLRDSSRDFAIKEVDDLKAFAKEDGLAEEFQNWDYQFYTERQRKKLFDFSDEAVRPYFPLPRVLDGLFQLVHKLFGISVKESENPVTTWHPDVTYYDIFDESGKKIAGFFLDPYSRPENKRGGAWMDTCIDRGYYEGELFLPVAYLICNGTPPSKTQVSTLSFREVETLFHEFGHGLQHMLTQVNESSVAGINGIEWDAVELPSQFMENWCYHKPILLSLTKHVTTGETMPDEIFEKIAKARTFHAALGMVRQLHFGVIDLELHHRFDPNSDGNIFEINRKIASQVTAMQPIPEDRFLCSFSHIFAGGYAAGYYSYKWAEVLSADAFSRFEEHGLDDEKNIQNIGREFRDTVLALGGSDHPMTVFKAFRGREPQIEALLRHNGLAG